MSTGKAKKEQEFPVLIIELVDQKDSNWEREGSRESGQPIFLRSPSAHFIKKTSSVILQDGSLRQTRYMQGAPSIFVDEQEKGGFTKHNPQTDSIVIENGTLTVVRRGKDINKYDYLKNFDGNADNESRPDKEAPALFYEIKHEEIAQKGVGDLTKEVEALDMVSRLYKTVGKETEYDEGHLNFLCTLFGVQAENNADKILTLASVARTRPSYFLDSIANISKEIKVDVLDAKKYGVISLSGDQASFIASGRKFLKFASTGADRRIAEVIEYLKSPEGDLDYKELRIELESAKVKEVELV